MGEPWAAWLDRDVVIVDGVDAVDFLQGQLSQDLKAFPYGSSTWALLLQPQGKVDAFVRVTQPADDVVWLDVDSGWGDRVVERLNRFKLRVKADLRVEPSWRCLAVRGSGAAEAAAPQDDWALPFEWDGLTGLDIVGPNVDVPDGVDLVDPSLHEAARIAAGFPRMGSELDERTIPAEAGRVVERSVSFTKGCYTGQELVARIDSRGGNVPRHLRLLRFEGSVEPGAEVVVDGKAVGTVTSSATGVALAYVGRAVTVPADGTVAGLQVIIDDVP